MLSVPYFNPLWSRILSFVPAALYSLLLLLYPKAVIGSSGEISQGALTLLLWGIAAGFVHGVGFVPRQPLWRVVFHPLLAWLLMSGLGIYFLR